MKVLYDAEGDALYIPIQPRGTKVDHSIVIDEARIVDMDSEKQPVGIEVLGASRKVFLEDLIERFGLEEVRDDLLSVERHRWQPMQYAPPVT